MAETKVKAEKQTVAKLSKTVEGLLQEVKLWRHRADWYYKDYGPNVYIDGASADDSILRDLYKQRLLAEELFSNSPVFRSIINTIATNVIQTGFDYVCNIPNPNKDPAIDKLNDDVEKHIKRWAKQCDAGGKLTLNQIVRVAVINMMIYGANFGLIVGDNESKYATKFRGIDPKAVTNPDNQSENDRFKNGIEVDKRGDPKRLWVKKSPGTGFFSAPFKDADGNRLVLHSGRFDFHNQTHSSVPAATIHKPLLDLDTFMRSELQKNVIAAQYNIIFKNKNVDGRAAGLPHVIQQPAGGPGYANGSSADLRNNGARRVPVIAVNPSTTVNIGLEEEIEQLDANTPNPNVEGYIKHLLKFICKSMGFSYNYMFCDWSDSNFSSARKESIDNHAEFKNVQQILIDTLLEPLISTFLRELLATGKVTGVDEDTLLDSVKIVAPVLPLLDAQKEIAAQAAAVENGFTTLQEATSKLGLGDYEHNLEQRAREIEKMKSLGIPLPNAPAPATGENTVPGQQGKPAGENSTRS
jgi:lambda family phage portal protein